jgi:hypothetical protein
MSSLLAADGADIAIAGIDEASATQVAGQLSDGRNRGQILFADGGLTATQ